MGREALAEQKVKGGVAPVRVEEEGPFQPEAIAAVAVQTQKGSRLLKGNV